MNPLFTYRHLDGRKYSKSHIRFIRLFKSVYSKCDTVIGLSFRRLFHGKDDRSRWRYTTSRDSKS